MSRPVITFEFLGKQLPLFCSIREAARLGILSENALRLREAQGKLPGVYSGRSKLVNLRQLLEMLDNESRTSAVSGQ